MIIHGRQFRAFVERRQGGTIFLVARSDEFPEEIREGEVVTVLVAQVSPVEEQRDALPDGYGMIPNIKM